MEHYKVFFAAPGGLEAERQHLQEILNEFNRTLGGPHGAWFEYVGWELIPGGRGRPQDRINKELAKCKYFILLLWNRWGSPPSAEPNGHSSGSEEEFELANSYLRSDAHPMRDIVLLFKALDPAQVLNPDDQLQKVLAFRERLDETKAHHYTVVDSKAPFDMWMRAHLARWLIHHEQGATEKVQYAVSEASSSDEISYLRRIKESEVQEGSDLKRAIELSEAGKRTEAETLFARCVVYGDDPLSYLFYANFLTQEGRAAQAEAYLDRLVTLPVTKDRRTSALRAAAFAMLGDVQRSLGEWGQAESRYTVALENYEEIADRHGVADTYTQLGNIRRGRGDTAGAEQYYRNALKIYEQIGSADGVAFANVLLGLAYYRRNHFAEAESSLRQALIIQRARKDKYGEAQAVGNLGMVLGEQKERLVEAKEAHTLARDLYQALGRKREAAGSSLNLGLVIRRLGDDKTAEELYRGAIKMFQELRYSEGLASAYHSLGRLKAMQGEFESAESFLREALKINMDLGRAKGIALVHEVWGSLDLDRGRTQSAIEHWTLSRDTFVQMGNAQRASELQALITSPGRGTNQ